MYSGHRCVKIIDFGFAIMTSAPLKTFCGTPSYMAPEIVQKKEYFGANVDKLDKLMTYVDSDWAGCKTTRNLPALA